MRKLTPEQRASRMGTDSMWHLMLVMALPAIFGNLGSSMYNIIDRLILGQFVGTASLGAVAVTTPLMNIMAGLSLLITTGGAALLSISLGEGNEEESSRVYTNMVMTGVIVSTTVALCFFFFADGIITVCGADPTSSLHEGAVIYLKITAFGLMFQLLQSVLSAVIRAEGNLSYAMWIILAGGIANVILDLVAVVGIQAGIQGAAWATVISQAVSTLLGLIYFISKKSLVKWQGMAVVSLKRVLIIAKYGIAPAVLSALNFITGVLINNTLRIYGDSWAAGGGDLAISAQSVIATAESLCFTFIWGINQGTSPILSYNYGAKKYDRVIQATLIGQLLAGIVATLCWGTMMFIPDVLFRIFSPDVSLAEFGVHAMRLSKIFVMFAGVQTLSSVLFSSIGDPRTATLISVVRGGLYLIPCVLILPRFFGLDGALFATSLSDLLSGVTIGILYILGLRRLSRLKNGEAHTVLT